MPFLLLHGLGGDRRQPLSLVGPCLPPDASVMAPDLRAHGDSTLIGDADDFSFAAVTAELVETVREQGFDQQPLTIIGISLGAALSWRLAHTALLPIERLVLLRPAFTDQPLPPHLALFPVIGELLHRHPPDRAEAIFRRTGLYRRMRTESRLGAAGVIEQFRKPDARARAVRLVELPRNRAFEADEPAVTLPATIIAAPRDPLHPLAVAADWHRRIPGSALVEVPARDDGMTPYLAGIRAAVRSALRSPPPG